jgi:hypothetical protein
MVSDTEYRRYFVHFFLSISCFCARNKAIHIASCMFIHVWNWRRIERISESSFRSCLVIWFTVWGVSYASIFSGDGTQCFAVYSTVIDRKFFTPPPTHTHTHTHTLGVLVMSKSFQKLSLSTHCYHQPRIIFNYLITAALIHDMFYLFSFFPHLIHPSACIPTSRNKLTVTHALIVCVWR